MAKIHLGILAAIALLVSFLNSTPVFAKICWYPPTFRELVDDNDTVIVVRLTPDPANPAIFQREAEIVEIIRSQVPLLEGARTMPIDRLIPTGKKPAPKTMILFGQLLRGQWDWYRGMQADAEALRCVKGLFKVDVKDAQQLLCFSFDFLNSPSQEVADRAFAEWSNASAADVDRAAKKLAPDQVRGLVQDRKTPRHVRDLGCFLLGHCGQEKDAALIRRHIESEEAPYASRPHFSYALRGYVLLTPKEGWALVEKLLKDKSKPIRPRLQALVAARYIHDNQPKLIAKQDVEQLCAALLTEPDLADLAIEDFRKWRCWEYTDQVLALFAIKAYAQPITRNAILRYALCCPAPSCERFVAEQRRSDSARVIELEEWLAFEKGSK
jgi:hypothetical protein